MKICIVTIIDNKNYGNRLQNYALQQVLKKSNFDVITGLSFFDREEWLESKSAIKGMVKRCVPFWYLKKKDREKRAVVDSSVSDLMRERIKRIEIFTKKHIETIPYLYARNYKHLRKQIGDENIDKYVAGSDQIWHPIYAGRNGMFLTFADEDKRLTCAASIGVDEIPEKDVERYKKNLMGLRKISVREEKAAQIVEELAGRKATVVMDPTLYLSKEEWIELENRPVANIPSKYVFTYFLGECPASVYEYAHELGLEVIALNEESMPTFYIMDPSEFIYLLRNATWVLTDSFHAVVFSIIFNKDFWVFDRVQKNIGSMFSRIQTILDKFGLIDRLLKRDDIIKDEHIPDSKWKDVNDLREKYSQHDVKILIDSIISI